MKLLLRIVLGLLVLLCVVALVMRVRAKDARERERAYVASLPKTIAVSSGSFPNNGDMPLNCTCKGQEASPALTWVANLPGVQSYVVLMTDYDVPTPAFPLYNLSHWVVYDLPATVRSLPEGLTDEQMRMLGGKTGRNTFGDARYIGPCPPIGRHAYVFQVFGLDTLLPSANGLHDKQSVLDAMKGHVLGYGELTGYFR